MTDFNSKFIKVGTSSLSYRAANKFVLSVSVTNGTYSISPQKDFYTINDLIVVDITPDEGYTTVGGQWDSGASLGFSSPVGGSQAQFRINQNTTVSFVAVEETSESGGPEAGTTNQISQFGITWTFDDFYQYGQYVNGDYWVKGPVNIVSITPACVVVGTRTMNGSMINPIPGAAQGYESSAYNWTSALNVAAGISAETPLFISVSDYPIKSLVSAIGKETIETKIGNPHLQGASILTVVNTVPSATAFRPPYCGNTKFAEITTTDIQPGILGGLAPIAGCYTINQSFYWSKSVMRWFERPWIYHGPNYPDNLMPIDNMPGYGRDMARVAHAAAIILNLNTSDTQADKTTLLYRFLQYGIDMSGVQACSEARQIWKANGGITNGHKLASVFAAKLFNHTGMLSLHEKSGDYLYDVDGRGPGNPPDDFIHFGNEDCQIHYVTQLDVDLTNGPTWSPDIRDAVQNPYSVDDIGLPEYGINNDLDPKVSNNYWSTQYRSISCCTMPSAALICHIMNMKTIWNNPAFFDYCDRYMETIKDGSIYAGKGWQWGTNGIDEFSSARMIWNLWHAYRKNYIEPWVAGKYWQGQFVSYGGLKYRCIVDGSESGGVLYTEQEPGTGDDWQVVS